MRNILRTWRRSPLVTAATVALVAVSTSTVIALFGPLMRLVERPLPYPQADRLVRVSTEIPLFDYGARKIRQPERLSSVFEHLAAYAPVSGVDNARLSTPTGPIDVAVAGVTPAFVETLGVSPRIGNAALSPDLPTMLISERLWRTMWASSSEAVGKSVRLGLRERTIVGVLPTALNLPIDADVWVPMTTVVVDRASGVEVIGRLRPQASTSAAVAALMDFKSQVPQRGSASDSAADGPIVGSLQEFLFGAHESTLRMLLTAALLFFLLSCAGIASLFVAQGIRDMRQTAVMAALGASASRLVSERLLAILATVSTGAALGVLLGWFENRWLSLAMPDIELAPPTDAATVLLVVVLCLLVTGLCGLVPAVRAVRTDIGRNLKPGSEVRPTVLRGRRTSHLEYLACAQLVVAIGLMSGTALVTKALLARMGMSSGVDTSNVMAFRLELPRLDELLQMQEGYFRERGLDPFGDYGPGDTQADLEELVRRLEPFEAREEERNRLFFETVSNSIAQLPSVAAVAAMEPMPFSEEAASPVLRRAYRRRVADRAAQRSEPSFIYAERRVSPGAFAVLRMKFTAGRGFTDQDVRQAADGAIPAVIGDTLAQHLWPDQDPVGKAFFDSTVRRQEYRVVGVVMNDVFTSQPSRAEGAVYIPYIPSARTAGVVVRVSPGGEPEQLRDALSGVLGGLSPRLPQVSVSRLSAWERNSLRELRVAVALLTAFAVLGVIVAGVGVYGIVTLRAAAREREMAVRLALGASVWGVRCLALWRGVRIASMALPGGVLMGWLLVRSLAHATGIQESGTLAIYALSCLVVMGVVLLAGVLPTFRLHSGTTAIVMRHE